MEKRWAKEKPKKRKETKRLCTKKSNFFRRKAKNIDKKKQCKTRRDEKCNRKRGRGKQKTKEEKKKKEKNAAQKLLKTRSEAKGPQVAIFREER